jgi:hypothetical protein
MYGLNPDINNVEALIPVESEEIKQDYNYPEEFYWEIIGDVWTVKEFVPLTADDSLIEQINLRFPASLNETQFVESHLGEI